ncbi:hypothetical protein SGFS_066880 [Streptomyces graminofaciens]|uniref:Uncharacterized protein n=1 Tax=Streptomyces graminofaciens TaxID=68212 RepID=A0ABN5VPV4_9ACTN|nr:hypothetical protein [Streptomyces graminofaciens]BBC35394.1 hypothetical protein SGFS_066880 [Streptomyces graminofaciens]
MRDSSARRLTTAAVAAAAGLAVLAPTAAQALDSTAARPTAISRSIASAAPVGSVASAAAKQPAKLTVASYITYLKQQKTPEARKTLAAFRSLSKTRQAKFVGYLQNRKVYWQLVDHSWGKIGQSVHHVETAFNKDVKIVSDATSKRAKDKNRTVTLTHTVTEYIYGIPVTSEQVHLSYRAPADRITAVVSAKAKVTNVNAAITIKGDTRSAIGAEGSSASAATFWIATPNVKSFGKAERSEHRVSGRPEGTWEAQLHSY